jgi:uncharacterized protein
VSAEAIDSIRIIDSDTHVIEPYDLWTSRVSVKRWGDMVPHVRWDEELQEDYWFFGDVPIHAGASSAMAGWHEPAPDHPRRLEDAHIATRDVGARLAWMDEHGIEAQVLYPNVQGFGTGQFLAMNDPDLMLACVQAYNDYLTDYSNDAPGRFIPIMALPFWDIDLSLKEMERCRDAGHAGVIFGQQPEFFHQPHLTDPHWEPLWAAAESLELPVNFHIAAGDTSFKQAAHDSMGRHAKFAAASARIFMNNIKSLSELIFAGVTHRYPRLNFVSVESGIGWMPYALAAMDWQWSNSGIRAEHPEYDLLPSDYFQRQFYGCFWFEGPTARDAIDELGADNFLFETDFPHPTSLSPGPNTTALPAKVHLKKYFSDLPDDILRKLMRDNAARLYHFESTDAATSSLVTVS